MYDPDAVVIPISMPLRPLRRAVLLAIFWAWAVFLAIWNSLRFGDAWLTAALGLGVLGTVWRRHMASVCLTFVLINRHGVAVEGPEKTFGPFEWSTIPRVKIGWITGTFYLYGTENRELITISNGRFGGHSVAKKCVKEINRLSWLYNQRHD